jgi:putative DNA primase/helicase
MAKHAISAQSERNIKAVINLARSEPGIPVLETELDANPWLLNISNGTLDLTTGTLATYRREDLITKVIPVHYDPDALCPHWDHAERFIHCVIRSRQSTWRTTRRSLR